MNAATPCAPRDKLPSPRPLAVVHHGDDFIVVDKPPGANLHRNQQSASFVDTLKADLNFSTLHLVHRLDDATSGLLLLARNKEAAAGLSALFRERRMAKFYLAIAQGKARKKQGSIIGDLVKSRGGNYRLCHSRDNPSHTHFFSYALGNGRRLYLLRPYTGRTHQLRVVMKSLGVPILGDDRYGPAGQTETRLYLHAYVLAFHFAGQDYRFVCPPVQGEHFEHGDLQQALLDLSAPWTLPWPSKTDF